MEEDQAKVEMVWACQEEGGGSYPEKLQRLSEGRRPAGKPKTWRQSVEEDMKRNIKEESMMAKIGRDSLPSQPHKRREGG